MRASAIPCLTLPRCVSAGLSLSLSLRGLLKPKSVLAMLGNQVPRNRFMRPCLTPNRVQHRDIQALVIGESHRLGAVKTVATPLSGIHSRTSLNVNVLVQWPCMPFRVEQACASTRKHAPQPVSMRLNPQACASTRKHAPQPTSMRLNPQACSW
eukprot:14455134-Alexandrium_andersonii.AAC.1